MWESEEIRAAATAVDGVAEEVSRVAADLARSGDVDFRSRAADALRARLSDRADDLMVARRSCDDAAAALREHAAAVARHLAQLSDLAGVGR